MIQRQSRHGGARGELDDGQRLRPPARPPRPGRRSRARRTAARAIGVPSSGTACRSPARLTATRSAPRVSTSQRGHLVVRHRDPVQPRVGQLRPLPAQRDQPPVPVQQLGVRLGVHFGPVQFGPPEGVRVLRVRHLRGRPAVRGELLPPSSRDGRAELRLRVRGEEQPRGGRPPLLAHPQHRGERRGEQQPGADLEQRGGQQRRRAGRRAPGCRPGRGPAGRRRSGAPGSRPGRSGRPCTRPRNDEKPPSCTNAPVNALASVRQRPEVARSSPAARR